MKSKAAKLIKKAPSHITVNVSQDLRNQFKSCVAKDGKTIREVIIELMKNYIEKINKNTQNGNKNGTK